MKNIYVLNSHNNTCKLMKLCLPIMITIFIPIWHWFLSSKPLKMLPENCIFLYNLSYIKKKKIIVNIYANKANGEYFNEQRCVNK